MAALRRAVKLKPLLRPVFARSRPISTCRVLQGEWNQDWEGGEAPKTEIERNEIAKRFGLIPEDYKPYVRDGQSYGDYPELPYVGEGQKDPYWDWTDPCCKRDFADPVHPDVHLLIASRGDPGHQYIDSPTKMITYFCVAVVGFFLIAFVSAPYGMFTRMYDTWYPYQLELEFTLNKTSRVPRPGGPVPTGERNVHYTFEPVE